MADSKSSTSPSGKNVKAPNIFERAKEEFEAVVHNGKNRHEHHKETHGLRDDIDANTPTSSVKAPNVFERAKEEIEAIVEAIHSKKESKGQDSDVRGEMRNPGVKTGMKSEKSELHSETKGKAPPSRIDKTKEGFDSPKHKPHHHKETHGRSGDIYESTSIDEVKAPNVFERAKEEIEAIIDSIHPKKDSGGGGHLPK